jgi:GNAT superfamily N-acetyltransferase
VDGTTLARLEHENLIGAFGSAATSVPGALVRHEAGVMLMATGLPIQLFNQVVIELDTATPKDLAAAVDVLRDRAAPFVVNLRRGIDDRFVPEVERLGLELPTDHPAMPGMARHPLPSSASAARPDLEIRRIDDTAGLEDHIRTAAAGFGMPEDLLRPWIGTDLWQRPGAAVYVGYVDGEPVSTGLGWRTGRTIGVYNIATVPNARKRGIGTAMTERIVDDGAAAGCEVAILQSSEMGRPIYEKLGFRTVVEYDGWIDQAQAVDGAAPAA